MATVILALTVASAYLQKMTPKDFQSMKKNNSRTFLLPITGFGIGYIIADLLPDNFVVAVIVTVVICFAVAAFSYYLDDFGDGKSGTGSESGDE